MRKVHIDRMFRITSMFVQSLRSNSIVLRNVKSNQKVLSLPNLFSYFFRIKIRGISDIYDSAEKTLRSVKD